MIYKITFTAILASTLSGCLYQPDYPFVSCSSEPGTMKALVIDWNAEKKTPAAKLTKKHGIYCFEVPAKDRQERAVIHNWFGNNLIKVQRRNRPPALSRISTTSKKRADELAEEFKKQGIPYEQAFEFNWDQEHRDAAEAIVKDKWGIDMKETRERHTSTAEPIKTTVVNYSSLDLPSLLPGKGLYALEMEMTLSQSTVNQWLASLEQEGIDVHTIDVIGPDGGTWDVVAAGSYATPQEAMDDRLNMLQRIPMASKSSMRVILLPPLQN